MVGRVDEVEEEHAHRGQDAALVRDLGSAARSRTPKCGRWRRTAGGSRPPRRARAPCRWPDGGSRSGRGASRQPNGNAGARSLCWDRRMMTRYVPYASRPHRLAFQLISDIVVIGWAVLWVWIGLAVHHAISTIGAAGREVENGANGIAGNLQSAGHSTSKVPLIGDALGKPLSAAADAARDIAGRGTQHRDDRQLACRAAGAGRGGAADPRARDAVAVPAAAFLPAQTDGSSGWPRRRPVCSCWR